MVPRLMQDVPPAVPATVPPQIRDALYRVAKSWLLENYVGGRRKLLAWDADRRRFVRIFSFSLGEDTPRNLRMLVRLAKAGVLIEIPRQSPRVGTRSFTLPSEQLDVIGRQAQADLEAAGYVVGQMMSEIGEVL